MQFKIFKFKKSFKENNLSIKSDFYWKIFLFLATFLILISFIFGYYFFTKIEQEFIPPKGDTGLKIETVKKERIKNTLDYFSQKTKKTNEILNSSSSILDPMF